MTSRTWTIIGAIVAVILVGVAAVFAVKGVTGKDNSGQMAEEHTDEGADIDPVASDPDVAAQSALVRGFTWEPARQESDFVAFVEAEDVTTTHFHELAQRGLEAQAPTARPKQWESWAKSNDDVRAVVTINSHDVEESGDKAVVKATVEQRIHHRDGDTTPYSKFNVDAHMENGEGPWRLADYTITSVDY
ncbi:hypothetical protein [uncultured Corynebacterium sp.]|uniref:hypothetical protein n=1 Tax=uncultured Corynebacterium sp. TaxID=159447 RepID=UPI002623E887|nr:hypothetical protein [uncultured Corynebacterium sp.]